MRKEEEQRIKKEAKEKVRLAKAKQAANNMANFKNRSRITGSKRRPLLTKGKSMYINNFSIKKSNTAKS